MFIMLNLFASNLDNLSNRSDKRIASAFYNSPYQICIYMIFSFTYVVCLILYKLHINKIKACVFVESIALDLNHDILFHHGVQQ